MAERALIFNNPWEDFGKIFLPTLLVFPLFLFPDFYSSELVVLFITYFLDGGHVYSTLLEQYFDPEERKKSYVWQLTLLAFVMNLIVAFFYNSYFFTYIFYFTVFHNMRQGLGVTFLYRRGEREMAKFIKFSYYFLTMVPFLLFHFRERPAERLSESIIKPLDVTKSYTFLKLLPYYNTGIVLFIVGVIAIYGTLLWKKQTKGLLSLGFFALVYGFAFLLSQNELQSYFILIVSHAVPYFWLMEKRLVKTHSNGSMKKFAVVFLFLTFMIGGLFDFFHQDILEIFDRVSLTVMALLYTPLISHFLFDGVIWTRDNKRFQLFLKN